MNEERSFVCQLYLKNKSQLDDQDTDAPQCGENVTSDSPWPQCTVCRLMCVIVLISTWARHTLCAGFMASLRSYILCLKQSYSAC